MIFSTNKFEMKAIGDLIFQITFFNGSEIELSDAEVMNEKLDQFSGGQRYCVLLNLEHQSTTSPESRAYVGSKARSERRIALAIVTESIANKLVGNFFIQFNKPSTPTKLFTDSSNALEWLKDQKNLFDVLNK